jgi:hypothetical protein
LSPEAGGQISEVYRYVARATSVVIKVRPGPLQRSNRCLDAQRTAANTGFPCAKPLTKAAALDGAVIVSVEE